MATSIPLSKRTEKMLAKRLELGVESIPLNEEILDQAEAMVAQYGWTRACCVAYLYTQAHGRLSSFGRRYMRTLVALFEFVEADHAVTALELYSQFCVSDIEYELRHPKLNKSN